MAINRTDLIAREMFDDMQECSDLVMAAEAEVYTSTYSSSSQRKKKSEINTKRFSDEQIKSLESIFENETRLEPRKKLQLAKELGLQPRQVAIWFQNKRARWKSKQIERDYNTLLANYNSLAARHEALKKEKQTLATQLQKLKESMQKVEEESQVQSSEEVKAANSVDSDQSYSGAERVACMKREADRDDDVKPNFSEQGPVLSCIKPEYFGLEDEPDLLILMEPSESSLTSAEDWDKFEPDGLLDQSDGVCAWWDYWS